MRRREFLKLVATSTTGAVLFTGCGGIGDGDPEREFKIESPVENPLDVIYGRDNWYASFYPHHEGGYGIITRVFEGRAKKVDGNPDFPTNRGGSSPASQSLVQEVYHPDRITGPLKLSGNRGSGQYDDADWDSGLQQLASAIQAAQGQPGSALLITEPVSGSLATVIRRFADAVGARHVVYEPEERVVLREAMRRVFNSDRFPTIDLANTKFLVSFSADFLHNWIAPTQFSRGYGDFRQGRPDVRGTYYHVGPQLSGTASNADRWLPINPGTEGLVALAMAQVMAAEGLVEQSAVERVYSGITLDDYAPDRVAERTGLSAEQITELAHHFASEQPSVAIAGTSAAGHTNGLFNLTAVFALNQLVGSVGQDGGLQLNPPSPVPDALPDVQPGLPLRDWQTIAGDLASGKIKQVLVHGANPVYGLPPAIGFEEALGNAEAIISFSSFMDETTAFADVILPDLTVLESWGLHVPNPGPGFESVGLQQPVVNPFHPNTQSFPDVLIRVTKTVGGDVAEALPWENYEAAVREMADTLRTLNRGNVDAEDAQEFFVTLQAQGGWWAEDAVAGSVPDAPAQPITPAEPQFAGDEGSYPLQLLPFPLNALGYGETAHLPWLQALPEPISTAVWGTWVELNPTTADGLGVQTGDVVTVTSPDGGSVELPVYVNPAAAPTLALVPFGQGHRQYTRYAQGRGVNPVTILAPQSDGESGALAWAATRVRIEPTGRRVRLARFEGQLPAYQVEEFPIIQVTRPKSAAH